MYKLNRRVTVRQWAASQNSIGSPVQVQVGSWSKWAQVEDRFGNQQVQSDQQVWVYDNKVVMRYEKSRPTLSNMTLDYEGTRMLINSVEIKTEGYKAWEICRCSKVDINIEQS